MTFNYSFGAFDKLLFITIVAHGALTDTEIDELLRSLPDDLNLSNKTRAIQKFSAEINAAGDTVIGVLLGSPKAIFHPRN